MTVAASSIPYYLSLDVDHNVSADTLLVTLDKTLPSSSWVTAAAGAPSAALIAEALTKQAVPAGFTRYWWSFTSGAGVNELPLVFGINRVHGHLTDSPAEVYEFWKVYAHNE